MTDTFKFPIKNRFTGAVIFEADMVSDLKGTARTLKGEAA